MRALLPLFLAIGLAAAAGPGTRVSQIRVSAWADSKTAEAGELDPKAFSVKLDGSPAPVLATLGPSSELMLILALDFTGDLNLVEIAKQAAIDSIQSLPTATTVALLHAQDGMRVILDPTTDREALAKAIRELPVSGKAGFLGAVEDASRIADRIVSKSRIRAAVIFLTDSSIYNFREDYTNPVINRSDSHDMSRRFPEGLINEEISTLGTKLAPLQAPLFITHLAYRTDRLEQAYQSGQLQLAAATGGSAVFCASSAEIPDAVAATFANAASHYLLDVRVPENAPRTLRVEIENGGRTLNYRTRLSLPSK
jgi:hypothetical protein